MKLPHQPAEQKAACDEKKDTGRYQPLLGARASKKLL
jgi:hypothetical protein